MLGVPVPVAVDRIRDVAKAAGGNPPPAMASDREVLAYVRLKPGAIGYVSLDADVSGVKVVAVGGKTEHALAPAAGAAAGRRPRRDAAANRARAAGYPQIAKIGQGAGHRRRLGGDRCRAATSSRRRSCSRSRSWMRAAVEAVKKWKYSPTVVNGVAVPVKMVVQVTFAL